MKTYNTNDINEIKILLKINRLPQHRFYITKTDLKRIHIESVSFLSDGVNNLSVYYANDRTSSDIFSLLNNIHDTYLYHLL